MSDYKIKVGDRVSIYLNNDTHLTGVVKYMPQATGDCWYIVDDDDITFYVQTYFCIAKLKESKDE